ncbi:snapalysin family zinc-dependent metalloprotease [Streptomyces boncukensis]|uniref:Extracellular small neutral protease n=1 Tax=Streptomyces boncukensis TaxID=2711219 RepID=A0A6G4X066_9ACTN|nr:snapalysin family zinc-dependent metalloprotease [Streptomyces boncukensis]NGO70778.1 snapalysin family zinc-dependent metalloprotease [Streptomyces boncukensis]
MALLAVLAGLCALFAGQTTAHAHAPATAGAPEGERARAAVVVTYDASRSAEFADEVRQGAEVWNESVQNVQLQPVSAGQRADVTVIADNGWPRAIVSGLGRGTVYMGRIAVNQGYDEIRIAAHEFGHILGLPDRKPGPCSSLMSGSTGGVSCTNPYPNAQERAEVERNFGSQYEALRHQRFDRVFVDRP